MRPSRIVVLNILSQHLFKMAATANQDLVQALGSCGEYPALGKRVGPGRPQRGADDLDAPCLEHLVEGPQNLESRSGHGLVEGEKGSRS